MQTILNKLLKTPTGKYSRKSFMLVVSFLITMLIGLLIVLGDMFLKYTAGDTSVGVFNALLLFVTGLATASVVDKKITSKTGEVTSQNEE